MLNTSVTIEKNKLIASKKQLLWIAMISISMFFAGLLSALIIERKDVNTWQGFVLPDYFLFSTIIICLSSLLLFFYKKKLKENKSVFGIFFSVLILGFAFTYYQVQGWEILLESGIKFLGPSWNKAGGYLYVLTLMHLLHLFGGLIALIVSNVKIKRNLYNSSNYLGLQLTSTYWHFLTFLWIVLFIFLKTSIVV